MVLQSREGVNLPLSLLETGRDKISFLTQEVRDKTCISYGDDTVNLLAISSVIAETVRRCFKVQ